MADQFHSQFRPESRNQSDANRAHVTKVLLVEDDSAVLEELYDIIRIEGWTPLAAPSVEAAMKLLTSDPDIHVVVTDVHFSAGAGMANGIQFISRARAKFADRALTYIVVSGDPDKVECSLQEGAFKFLPKPLDPDRLIQIINDAIENGHRDDDFCDDAPITGGVA